MALVAALARGEDDWQFQVGGVYQWGMKMSTRGPAVTTPHNYSVPPGVSVDPLTQTYVDGYVRRTWVMDDPLAVGVDRTLTWNWSYNNYNNYDNQYNAVDQTLAFHSQKAQSQSGKTEKDFSGGGVEFSAKRRLLSCCGFDLGVDLALALFPDAQASQSSSASSRFNTYYYSDPWGIVSGVSQPYQGPDYNYNNPSIPGNTDVGDRDLPPIAYTPIRVTDTIEQSIVSTKADLYRVRAGCGPTLTLPITEKLRVYATPQFTLSLVHAEVTRQQTVTSTDMDTGVRSVLSSGEVSNDKTELMGGILLAAGVDYQFAQNWVVGAYIGREWIPDMHIDVGVDRTRLDVGGYEASLYVGTTF
jgi:hypothetical protein